MFNRALSLPKVPGRSFYLWGPRQTGKSSLLAALYPQAKRIDLLNTELRVRYTREPQLLRMECQKLLRDSLVVIDEVQLVPDLLNEVHWLIENQSINFALCGSSARKLRKSSVNLLGGRALRYEMHGLVSEEIGEGYDLLKLLNIGYLPALYNEADATRLLDAYIADYLQIEIAAEGIVRNLPSFASFLQAVALADTELVKYSNIASECGVSAPTAKEYYQILVDTLVGRFLPAYQPRAKRRIKHAPKFYLFDVGIVNQLARRGIIQEKSQLIGKAFENWVYHELAAYKAYRSPNIDLTYLYLSPEQEVDFFINDGDLAIEAKAVNEVQSKHLKVFRSELLQKVKIKKKILVSLDGISRTSEDGVLLLNYKDFTKQLWSEELITT